VLNYPELNDRCALAAGYQMFVPIPVEADELAAIIVSLVGRTKEVKGA
jgi:hypothetical protein